MREHPRYRGLVVDSHCHADVRWRDAVTATMRDCGVNCWLNLWNTEWPPPPFALWREQMADGKASGMVLGHAPDLSVIGGPDFAARIERSIREAAGAGAASLKVWKNLGLRLRDVHGRLVAVDDPRLDPVWRTASEVNLPVVIHVADPVAFFSPLDGANERLSELREHPDWWFGSDEFPPFLELIAQLERTILRHPLTTFIGAHMGCYAENLKRVAEMLETHPNYMIDTSARIAEIGRRDPEAVRDFFVAHDDRILFGSDLCRTANLMLPEAIGGEAEAEFFARYWRFFETDATELEHPIPIQGAWKIHGIDLPDAVLEKLYLTNAQRVLPRVAEALEGSRLP